MYVQIALASLLLLQNPVVKNGNGNTKTQGTQKQKQASPSPSIPRIADAPSAPQPQSESKNSEANPDQRTYRVKVLSQPDPKDTNAFLIYVGLTALAMAVNAAILLAIVRQNKINWRQVRINARAARAAKASADVAKKSVDALVNIERPWIVVTIRDGITEQYLHDPKTREIKNRIFFNWFLTNHGKTTALVCEIIALLEIKTRDEVDELRRIGAEDQPKLRPDAFIIGPGQSHEFSGINMVPFWTPEQRKSVFNREAYLVAHGIVKYRDMIDSSVIHQTPFIGLYIYAEEFNEGTFRRFYDAPGYNKYT